MQENAEATRLWFTPEEAKEILGFGRTKMYELLRGGVIKAVKFGHHWRIPAAELDPEAIIERLGNCPKPEEAGLSQR